MAGPDSRCDDTLLNLDGPFPITLPIAEITP